MANISVSLPADGTTADVSDYNTPLNTIVTDYNGNIDNSNIAAAAAIAGSKLADNSVTATKVDFSTFLQSSLATSVSRVGVAAPQTGMGTQNYNFVNGRKYLVAGGISTSVAASTGNIRDLNLRINGTIVRTQRFQSPVANSQSGGTIIHLYTAPATATYTVDLSMTQAAGSGNFDIENPFTVVVPLSN